MRGDPVTFTCTSSSPSSESHGGEDVTLCATGNGSRCVAGVIEQNRIYDLITAAFGWRAPVCND